MEFKATEFKMKIKPWIAVIAVLSVTSCNTTVGECWPVGQGDLGATVGGGPIIPGGAGGSLGDAPSGSGGTRFPEEECNSKPQEPASPQMPANAYINCKARGFDATACSEACLNAGASCVPLALHPYKSEPGPGKLTFCKNGSPSTTCTWTFANGDACSLITTFGIGIKWICIYTGG